MTQSGTCKACDYSGTTAETRMDTGLQPISGTLRVFIYKKEMQIAEVIRMPALCIYLLEMPLQVPLVPLTDSPKRRRPITLVHSGT